MAGLVPEPVSSAAATTPAPSAPVVLPKTSESDQLLKIRHSMSHVMAMAVQQLFPKARVTIGPWTETGFYYDFDNPDPFTEADLKAIKKGMIKIINKKLPLERVEVSRGEAEAKIKAQNEPYKLEILEGLQEPITLYTLGEAWWDLCAGPHVDHTGQLNAKAFELESVAGAYWRGDETKAQLQRIYGTAWETPEQLAEHKRRKEEALRRDHRRIGKDLDLFSIEDEAGAGLVFWHPRGARMRLLIEDFWRQAHFEGGYELLYTPHVADISLWKTSGHLDFYAESMFGPMEVDEREYQLKPMNCPFHVLTYASKLHSYRELPIRWAELGTVYRYERPGVMHGLMRVRGFTQDDAHVFCLPEQISDEILKILDLTERILSTFDFNNYEINLSTRPEKSIGDDDVWDLATKGLIEALERKGWAYKIDEGGGAFYGPKIDLKIEDAIGRMWQCSTIQLDFNLPERFKLDYIAADGSKQRPIMIHRAIFGSLERFFGIMSENYAGDYPFWLAPEQVRLLPVTDEVQPYAEQLLDQLTKAGVRATVDRSGDRLGKLIRTGEQMKIPVLAVIGAKEAQQSAVSLRSRRDGDLGVTAVADLLRAAQMANGQRAAGLELN
ncbi:threonine--tRNA ligase [Synechococcus sp. HB1133]|uniref:threonine--tRNA ligase n=1 Tax=unclassified Synechococcus TaxID=2626047 RepID=UPI00140AF0C7|nr:MULTISPECIES: threonine--tRNA ligase [unclassified Synechococcus]MCB4395123.1 threonine--tRNA ligase [Synechococcus sp. PH41509]MCB4422023.1 threonine--tRNA ligase [Synechococcus sp. HB1133]MCB4430029.1 threonine--tRNA ligase [Synechococcus sp. HBA1120]NHI80966.1 threonine--tRNA ligase [Synechococcus sp. HB1133]